MLGKILAHIDFQPTIMMQGFSNKDKFTVFGFIAFVSFVLVTIISVFLYTAITAVQSTSFTISLLNFYPVPVFVEVDNRIISLDVMEIATVSVKNPQEQNIITIRNEYNEIIDQRGVFSLNETPNIAIETLHAHRNFCYFKSNVTDFYYQTSNETDRVPVLTNISVLARAPIGSSESIFINESDIFVYPGAACVDDLPKTIQQNQKVFGVYPIPCDNLANVEEMKKTVLLYQNYDEAKHREFLLSQLAKIDALTISDLPAE